MKFYRRVSLAILATLVVFALFLAPTQSSVWAQDEGEGTESEATPVPEESTEGDTALEGAEDDGFGEATPELFISSDETPEAEGLPTNTAVALDTPVVLLPRLGGPVLTPEIGDGGPAFGGIVILTDPAGGAPSIIIAGTESPATGVGEDVPPAEPSPTPRPIIFPTRTPVPTPIPLPTAFPTAIPEPGDVWTQPLNLSQSGSASIPSVAVQSDGTLHAVWWDEFNYAQYAYTTVGGWTVPRTIPEVVGVTSQVDQKVQAPGYLRTYVTESGTAVVFWLDENDNLMSSRSTIDSNSWSTPKRAATGPVGWDIRVGGNGAIHVAYLRATDSEQFPAGAYYRVSTDDGESFESAVPIQVSNYFRTIEKGEGHIRIADNDGQLLVGWDDPRLDLSFLSRSVDGGQSFEEPRNVESLQDRPAQHIRLLPLSEGSYLRLWEAGETCNIYQQVSVNGGESWTTPARVLESLGGCLGEDSYYITPDNKLLYVNKTGEGDQARTHLMIWDGQSWADPLAIQFDFQNPITNRTSTIGCASAVQNGTFVSVVGCDQGGDIVVSKSVPTTTKLLPVLEQAWEPGVVLSNTTVNVGVPSVAVEPGGNLHILWGEAANTTESDNTSFAYLRGDGENWSAIATVIDPETRVEDPSLVTDANGILHAAWSNGPTGTVMYSRTFGRDAVSEDSWIADIALPAVGDVGGWPSLAIAPDQTLHAIYTVPLNENRGVYHTLSTDQGLNWSTPTLMFDAASENWQMARNTDLRIDRNGRLHAVWAHSTLPSSEAPLGAYYAYSDDDGLSWTEPGIIDLDGAGYPQLELTNNGEVHIAWVRSGFAGLEVWHQWSPDSGQTWSEAAAIPGTQNVTTDFGFASNGQDNIYLSGILTTEQNSASLFFTFWNGQEWVGYDTTLLGIDAAQDAGVRAQLLPNGKLGLVYRVQATTSSGVPQYVIGYTQRQVTSELIAAQEVFPTQDAELVSDLKPTEEAIAAVTPVPTFTQIGPTVMPPPEPFVDEAVDIGGTNSGRNMRIAIVAGAMVLISLFSLLFLRRRQ